MIPYLFFELNWWVGIVLGWVSVAVINTVTKSNLGRERLILLILPHHQRKFQQKLRQEVMQKAWRSVAYELAPHGLHILLSYSTQDHQPMDGTAHSELDAPTSAIY